MCIDEDGAETTACSAAFIRAAIAQRWEQPDIAAQVLDQVGRRSSCKRPGSDADQWRDAWSGYLGNLNIDAVDEAVREPLVVRPIERMVRRCGQDYTVRIIGRVDLSEVDRRSAMHVVSPGKAAADGNGGITSVTAVVDASSCTDVVADASSLGDLWGDLLGASWVDHPRLHELAYQPMARLGERCGSEHAANVIYEIGLTGATYRALDDAAWSASR